MTFWSSQFHKSDAEKSSQKALDDVKDDIVQMQVVLGNASTERSLVHDVETLKVHREELRKTTAGLQGDLMKVRKRKGPRGERGLGWLSGDHPPPVSDRETGRIGDFYLDKSSLIAYKKFATGWQPLATLRGPKGMRGEAGQAGDRGERGPRGARGEKGEPGGGSRGFKFYDVANGVFRRTYQYTDVSIQVVPGITRITLHGAVTKIQPQYESTGSGVMKLFTSHPSMPSISIILSRQPSTYSFTQSMVISTQERTLVIHLVAETEPYTANSTSSPLSIINAGITVEHGNE